MAKSEAQDYLDEMYKMRGYVLDFHKVLAAEDLTFLKAFNPIVESAYTPRLLDRKTKELIMSAVLAAVKANTNHIKSHLEQAMAHGATKEEALQAMELVLAPAGVPSFMLALQAWSELANPKRLEPTPLPKRKPARFKRPA